MRAASNLVTESLEARLSSVVDGTSGVTLGVSVYDYLSGCSWQSNGDRWFHAASIIKLPVLMALFDGIDRGRFSLYSRLHVRNRFLCALDGEPFRVDPSRDADADVHAAIGRTMRLRELAERMIVRSSNLATNLLINLIGVDQIRGVLEQLGVAGVDVRRGVEDDRAFAGGINNMMTPNGAVALLRARRAQCDRGQAAGARHREVDAGRRSRLVAHRVPPRSRWRPHRPSARYARRSPRRLGRLIGHRL